MNNIKKTILSSIITIATIGTASATNLIAGYLDTTATGSATKVDLSQATQDGYNTVIFAFAKVSGTSVDFFNSESKTLTMDKMTSATQNGMKKLISFGGQNNTFNPGSLSSTDTNTLANNMVAFVIANGFDGIDFDLEEKIDPNFLKELITDIKIADSNIIVTAAPQINDGVLVTTGTNADYSAAISAGLFDYLFIQEYNTGPENEISFISSSFDIIKNQVPSNTKIVVGEPTAAVAAGIATIYHPSANDTLTTQEVTENMLPELKKINTDPQYGGVMGWSLNVDYDAADYSDSTHVAGSFAYGLKDCVINGQCDTAPTPKPAPVNYELQTSNTDSTSGVGVTLTISDNSGDSFTSDWIGPASNKVYSATSNPSASSIEGKTDLSVSWETYAGGPSGVCSGSFDLNTNKNIMVNPSTGACAFTTL